MESELLESKEDENLLIKESERFNELKEATVISLKHQEKEVDAEFNSIHEDVNEHEFSYEENNFAMKLLKEHSILLPKELIKDEYVHQGKDLEDQKLYVPTWKQGKDVITSIGIYNSTIDKLNRQDMNRLAPDKLKDTIVKLSTYEDLTSSYQKYLNDITPIIDQEIQSISTNKHVTNADVEVKVALLEEYSTLNEEEKDHADIEKLLHDSKEKHEKESESFQNQGQSQEGDDIEEKRNIGKALSSNADRVAEGIFALMSELTRDKNQGRGRGKKDRTKPHRRKGTDGREL